MSPLQLGHAAITLEDGTHIRLWPTEKTEGKKCKENPRDVGSLSEDVSLEGRRPDKTFEVTGLDENRINNNNNNNNNIHFISLRCYIQHL